MSKPYSLPGLFPDQPVARPLGSGVCQATVHHGLEIAPYGEVDAKKFTRRPCRENLGNQVPIGGDKRGEMQASRENIHLVSHIDTLAPPTPSTTCSYLGPWSRVPESWDHWGW